MAEEHQQNDIEEYQQEDFEGDKDFCDVVMKGGITSGVVYPYAVCQLAKKYKIKAIGGTSAGAVAAAVTAAAEYARDSGGYIRFSKIPEEVASSVLEKFQPERHLRPLFKILCALLEKQTLTSFAGGALRGYWFEALLGTLPGLIVAWGLGWDVIPWNLGWLLFGLLLAVVGAALMVGWALYRSLTMDLPDTRYGLCSGLTVGRSKSPALTDWLADTIDSVAGMKKNNGKFTKPLTFGDLKEKKEGDTVVKHEIGLAIMTTDLSMRRPYRLPFRDDIHFFDWSEFEKLLPKRILDYMRPYCEPLKGADGKPLKGDEGNLYKFPPVDNLPIVVAARMSYSFPGFIQAVPVYKCDRTLLSKKDREKPVRCLFSDGGLSSNFPIHFFDKLWPNSPTFGISLEEYNPKRHPDEERYNRKLQRNEKVRAYLGKPYTGKPDGKDEDAILPILEIKGLLNFLMTLVDTAKDWQDNLQSILPGYRERVVRIALNYDDGEGGFNLAMEKKITKQIANYGEQAGWKVVEKFNLERHRWDRFVIAMARIEEKLEELAQAYGDLGDKKKFHAFLTNDAKTIYDPQNQKESDWLSRALDRANTLVTTWKNDWEQPPTIGEGQRVPEGQSILRITPEE